MNQNLLNSLERRDKMRTPEQIQNLRHVITSIYGPYVAFFLTDTAIDIWTNRLQAEINKLPAKFHWEVKVRFENSINASWDDIEKEAMIPISSLILISDKCIELLKKYPDIISIQIINKETSEKIVFERDS